MKYRFLFYFLFFLMACKAESPPLATTQKNAWFNDGYEGALQQAKNLNKPLLIEFHASWCIYCNILDATILNDTDLVEISKNFVPLRIDVDKEVNREAIQKFKEYGVPLFITASADGMEFSRIADPSLETLKNLMATTLASQNSDELQKKFYEGLKYQMLADNEMASSIYRQILPALEAKPSWELAVILNFQVIEENNQEAALQFLKTFEDHPWRPLIWNKLAEISESDVAKNFAQKQTLEEIYHYLNPKILFQPNQYELIYLSLIPKINQSLGIKSEWESYREVAKEALKKAKNLKAPFLSKPYFMRAISFNIRGGNGKEAIRLAQKMVQEYPNEFTFYELLAWAYAGEGNWERAVQTQKKVVELAHELAKPKKNFELAQIMALSGDLKGAIELLDQISQQQITGAKEWTRRESKFFSLAKEERQEYETLLEWKK